MNMHISRLSTILLVVAAVGLTSAPCWAIFHMLGPSQNEWGLKYEGQLTAAEGDMANVHFTLADAGRLKPIHSATVVAFTPPDSSGGQSYLVKSRIPLKPTKDGKAAGQVQIPRKYINIAMIRILTLKVDGRHQSAGAAYYDIPLRKFLTRTPSTTSPAAPPTVATPPSAKVTR